MTWQTLKELNLFLLAVAILQCGGVVWYLRNGSPKLALITFLYAVTNVIFSIMKGM